MSSPWYLAAVNFHLCVQPKLRRTNVPPSGAGMHHPIKDDPGDFEPGRAANPASSAPTFPAATPSTDFAWFHDRIVAVAGFTAVVERSGLAA
jgi:hypothetical protein